MRPLIILLFLVSLAGCTSRTSTLSPDGSDLILQQEVKKSLALHQADTFRLNLGAQSFVTGFANQLTVDVVVTILDPAGKQVERFDQPARGPENFKFNTGESGTYKVIVAPFKENTGEYIIKIKVAEAIATEPAKRIDQLVNAATGEQEPGASIAVVRDGKIIYSKGFGMANMEYGIRNTPQTIFHIASVSKQFTAFSIAMLADQGKLSLDDDIRKYLPELHDFGTPITIRQLIHHTSGLRDQWNLLVMAGWRMDDVITRDQILRLIARQHDLNFPPGERHEYCNTGYTLMGEIVSRVTGQPFSEWASENLFLPLQMMDTQFYDDHERLVPGRSYSYYLGEGGFKKAVLNYANVGATSLFTTVEDLSKWAMNFEHPQVGNANVMKMMEERGILTNGDTLDYAFGQVLGRYKGLKTVSHGGADAGYRTMLLRFPDQKFSVSVFSNLASFDPYGLAYQIADAFLSDQLKEEKKKDEPETPSEPKKDEPFDPASVSLSDYTGRYYSEELQTFYELEVKNDTLVAHHPRHDDFKLIPEKPDVFSATAWWMGELVFTRDNSKKVKTMKASNGRVMNLVFARQ